MTLHTDLPIYKRGCELVRLAFNVQQQMPRSFKRTLGEKITVHCTDMRDLMALANASRGHERALRGWSNLAYAPFKGESKNVSPTAKCNLHGSTAPTAC